MKIIGAGMAGLLAGAMLRNKCSEIIEAQASLPNNHAAVLRFRSSVVGDTLGIPFKKVQMMKAVQPYRNPIADAMLYSKKIGSIYQFRSIINANGEVSTRYIAPETLIDQMMGCVTAGIKFNCQVDNGFFIRNSEEPIISTVPMPVLMDLLQYDGPRPKFDYLGGTVISAAILNSEAYCSLYIPDPHEFPYRLSITGNRLLIEISDNSLSHDLVGGYQEMIIGFACLHLGISSGHLSGVSMARQRYAKILPADEDLRKRFMIWATDNHNVYSLGRFATWRPGLLLDDVVNDVRVIQKLINDKHAYDHRRK
jgi:hypothetical protein